jgi:hypothetical protein
MYVDDTMISDEDALGKLLLSRWADATTCLPRLSAVHVGWALGDSKHFASARGFAVTRILGEEFQLIWSEKAIGQPVARIDAIVRHEIGHVADFAGVHPLELVLPPETCRELRADAIAAHIWSDPIRYDQDDVQTISPSGVTPRPKHLGE